MKRIRGFLLVGVFIAASAEGAAGQIIELIVPQVGVSFISYSGENVTSDTGIGFEAGGKLRAGSRFYVEAGFFWSTAGADVTIPAEGATPDELRIQDVSFPVSIGFKLIKTRPLALRLFAGVVPAFPTSVSENDLGIIKDDLKSTLWAGRAGLGLDLVLFTVDAGYDFGTSGILETGPESVKRNDFWIDFGLRFGF